MEKVSGASSERVGDIVEVSGKAEGENANRTERYGSYAAMRYVPVILFAVFSVLLFALFFAPIAHFNSPNSGIAVDSIGNVYTSFAGILMYDFVISGSAVTLLVVAAIAVVYSICAICGCVSGRYARRDPKAFIGASFAGNVSSVFYMIYIACAVLAFVVLGRILALDGGKGVLSLQPLAVLILAFDAAFMIVSVVTVVVRYRLEKKYPCLRSIERERAEARFARAKKR